MVRSGNQMQAKLYFHAAIYGNWEGDGYLQRRAARLELVRYLISQTNFEQARSELLVASGNAPSSDLEMQSKIADLLVESHYPADALNLYRQILTQHADYLDALEGAASTAYTMGDYDSAYHYLLKATNAPGYAARDAGLRAADEAQLHLLARIIVLDPSIDLPPAALAGRLLADRETARVRFNACLQRQAGNGTAPGAADPLAGLAARWSEEPKRLTTIELTTSPIDEGLELKLIDDTEKVTAQVCGAPTGDDAVLLRLAQVPSAGDLAVVQAAGQAP